MTLTPTAYPEINTLLDTLLSDLRTVLGDYFVGMYVHGSLALGDFVPDRSDVDVAVVMTEDLPDEVVAALAAMHERFRHNGLPYAEEIEVTYFSQDAIRRHDISHPLHPYYGEAGELEMGTDDHAGIIMRHILREHGIILVGPPPQSLVDPVTPHDLRRAVTETFNEWWKPFVLSSSLLAQDGYQVYAVFTMCRMRYTLDEGAVVSKSAAARWGMEHLESRWTPLIASALAWSYGDPFNREAETIAFIRDTEARIDAISL